MCSCLLQNVVSTSRGSNKHDVTTADKEVSANSKEISSTAEEIATHVEALAADTVQRHSTSEFRRKTIVTTKQAGCCKQARNCISKNKQPQRKAVVSQRTIHVKVLIVRCKCNSRLIIIIIKFRQWRYYISIPRSCNR